MPLGSAGGITAEIPNPAVSGVILRDIQRSKEEKCSEEDIITRLRLRTIPAGYNYHTWHPGMQLDA